MATLATKKDADGRAVASAAAGRSAAAPSRPPPRKKYQQAFDDLLKAARSLSTELGLPTTPAANPILHRLNSLTGTALGGPFPPALLSLSDPSITSQHMLLLLRLLTSRPAARYQQSFQPDLPLYAGLRDLRVWGCRIGDLGLQHLADGLRLLPSMRVLCLYNCGLTAASCSHLAAYLSQRTAATVVSLSLEHNGIGSAGLAALVSGLSHNSSVSSLSLDYCELDDAAPDIIAQLLSAANAAPLSFLSLTGNALTAGVLSSLSCCLPDSRIATLHLSNAAINLIPSLSPLACLLSSLSCRSPPPALRRVTMEGSIVGMEGMRLLLQELTRCTAVLQWDVSPMEDATLFRELRSMLRERRLVAAAAAAAELRAKVRKKKKRATPAKAAASNTG